MDEHSFHHALQQLKTDIDNMNTHYQHVSGLPTQPLNYRLSSGFPAFNPPPPRTGNFALPASTAMCEVLHSLRNDLKGLEARMEQTERSLETLQEDVRCIDPPQLTPATTTSSGFDPTTDMPQVTHAQIGPAGRIMKTIGLGCVLSFNPDIESGKESIDAIDQDKYTTSDPGLFLSKLKHAALYERIEQVDSYLQGSALTWYNLGYMDCGRHEHVKEDGSLDVKAFASAFSLVFARTVIDPRSVREVDVYTKDDVKNGRSLVRDYAIPILERAGQLLDLDKEGRMSVARTLIHGGIRFDTSEWKLDEWQLDAPRRRTQTLSQYLSTLRLVEAGMKRKYATYSSASIPSATTSSSKTSENNPSPCEATQTTSSTSDDEKPICNRDALVNLVTHMGGDGIKHPATHTSQTRYPFRSDTSVKVGHQDAPGLQIVEGPIVNTNVVKVFEWNFNRAGNHDHSIKYGGSSEEPPPFPAPPGIPPGEDPPEDDLPPRFPEPPIDEPSDSPGQPEQFSYSTSSGTAGGQPSGGNAAEGTAKEVELNALRTALKTGTEAQQLMAEQFATLQERLSMQTERYTESGLQKRMQVLAERERQFNDREKMISEKEQALKGREWVIDEMARDLPPREEDTSPAAQEDDSAAARTEPEITEQMVLDRMRDFYNRKVVQRYMFPQGRAKPLESKADEEATGRNETWSIQSGESRDAGWVSACKPEDVIVKDVSADVAPAENEGLA